MANLKTEAEADFVLTLKDGRKFWEGMEVEWCRYDKKWAKHIISNEITPTSVTLELITNNPELVRIPAPPPEKTPLERMREVDWIINVDGRIWRAIADLKPALRAIVWLDSDDVVRVQGHKIHTMEILLDSGEWKNLKEMVG